MSFLKGINRSACISWSPIPQQGEYIAAATVVGTTDLNFDTSGHLELFQFDASSELQIAPSGKTELPDRVQSLAWGSTGLIGCGLPSGAIHFLDSNAIVNQGNDPAIATIKQHNSPVSALEFNKLQPQIMASGAEESEVFIWNLAKPESPVAYAPGVAQVNKDPISALNWNSQVPYILATLSQNGRVVVWDLRNKRPAVQFMDRRLTSARSISWNPSNPMQLITASEDDQSPIIQVWNIRHTQMPTSTLTGHTQGIWSTSWSPHDSSLLLSTGKENRAICWNVEQGSIVQEIELRSEWNSEIEWAPQIPATFAVSSYQGQIGVYSVHDVKRDTPDPQTGLIDYSNPPSWLRSPAGASFGFGGKLVSVHKSSVSVQSALTRPDVAQSAESLHELFALDDCQEYCAGRIQSANSADEKELWEFLRAQFDANPRETVLAQLGFDREQIKQAISQFESSSHGDSNEKHSSQFGADSNSSDLGGEGTPDQGDGESLADELLQGSDSESANRSESKSEPVDDLANLFSGTSNDDLFGGQNAGQSAFDSFGGQSPFDSFGASGDDHGFDSLQSGSLQPAQQQDAFGRENQSPQRTILELASTNLSLSPISLLKDLSDSESLLAKALLVGDFQSAVEYSLKQGSLADALALSMCSGDSALQLRTRAAYFAQLSQGSFLHLADHVEKKQLRELIARSNVEEWRSTLAILCTYAQEEFSDLATELGDFLLDRGLDHPALLCFICGGDLERAISVSERTLAAVEKDPFATLQNLVETITVFRKASSGASGPSKVGENVISKYCEYAEILSAQGLLESASELLSFLEPYVQSSDEDSKLSSLLLRIRTSLESESVPPESSISESSVTAESNQSVHQQQQIPSSNSSQGVQSNVPSQYPSQQPQHAPIPYSVGAQRFSQPTQGPFGVPSTVSQRNPFPANVAPGPFPGQQQPPRPGPPSLGSYPAPQNQPAAYQNQFQAPAPVQSVPLGGGGSFGAQAPVQSVPLGGAPSVSGGSFGAQGPVQSVPLGGGGSFGAQAPVQSGPPVGVPSGGQRPVVPPFGAQTGQQQQQQESGSYAPPQRVPSSVAGNLPSAPPLVPFRVPTGPHEGVPSVEQLPPSVTTANAKPATPPPGLDIPDLLSAAIAAHKTQYGNNPAVSRNLDGCGSDRIKVLHERINSRQLSEETLEVLRNFVQAFEKRDKPKIDEYYGTLNSKKYTELTGKVMLGLKKLQAIDF